MDKEALTILAEMLNKARLQANAIEATAPQNGVYGKICLALFDTLELIFEGWNCPNFMANEVYEALLDGSTVREALTKVA